MTFYVAEGGHLCELCGKMFNTAVGRGSHQRWVHGVRGQSLRIGKIRVQPSEHDMFKILVDTASLEVTATHRIMVIRGGRRW